MATLDWDSSSSAASTSVPSRFDVFLSFRGKDIRNNFISFLHKALKDRGINVFVDSEKQWIGEAIGSTLRKAIEGSKISIPVFSKGYADSKWCLRELALIVECKSNGQLVLPIFYDIDPSHVRYQAGSFKEAFEKHEKNVKLMPDIVKGWREALETVGALIGAVIDETKDQAELVELVVKRILGELISNTHLVVCNYPIGIDSHVNDILSLLNIGSNDVQFVGICGFGGIGKTTIAKAIYNDLLLTFNKHCFLSDVREQATQCLGLVSLQKRLLKDIFKIDIDIADVHKGKKLIEQRICKEKVLVVLDDVDGQEQVDALVGKHTWFGQGSRVILTSRDEHILKVAKVDEMYKLQVLDPKKSLQLFSWHAFQNDQPPEDYMQLSHDVAHYSGGLPLTLEVVGSYLSVISDKEEWKSTIQKLKEIPDEKVQRRLKISYDNLKDDYHKAIFLDVACFFIGWDEETVISIWEACGYYLKSVMHTLIKRSLLKLEQGSNAQFILRMHDQIRDMGREIVREESPMEPGRRSRLWSYGNILEVLEEHKVTDMIKGMILYNDLEMLRFKFSWDLYDYYKRSETGIFGKWRFCLESKHFEMMSSVRFLDISTANFMGEFSCIPSTLRWLRWMNCPWGIVPTNFYSKRLVYLDLSCSKMKQAWNVRPQEENQCFKKLKVLNLNNCCNLSKSPDFSWFPYLEELDLRQCVSLEMLDQSIGKLSQLKYLIVSFCKSLNELPDGVGLLEKLEILDAKDCKGLNKLPRSVGRMRSLHSINLEDTGISKLPDDFSSLKNLKHLNLSKCMELKELPELPSTLVELCCDYCSSLVQLPDWSMMKNLTMLKLKDCIELEEIQGLEGTESLEELDVSGCFNLTRMRRKKLGEGTLLPCRLLSGDRYYSSTPISKIPDDFSSLKNLKHLILYECMELKELPELPSSLVELCCEYCYSLVRLPVLSRLKILTKLKLKDCVKLEEIQGLEGTESLEELDASGCYNLTRTRRKKLGQGIVLPDRLPIHGYSFTTADGIYTNSTGLILCIVFSCDYNVVPINLRISASVCQKEKTIRCLHSLKIEGVEFTTARDTIYIHYFKGFDWFGIPLQGKDAIEILDIYGPGIFGSIFKFYTVKFWKLLYENKEPIQQMPTHYSDASPSGNNMEEIELSDFFDLSCVYTEGEISLSLSLTCWSRVDVEGSNSVPKEKEEQEQRVLNKGAFNDDDQPLCPSLTLALTILPCPFVILDDGCSQQTQMHRLSHIQENGKTSPPSHDTEEEEDPERNNTMIDLLNCLGFESVSDVVEEEGEMLRLSKRACLHDNNDDEAPRPSLSLSLSTSCEMKSNNRFNLQQMLSNNQTDDDDTTGLSLSLALMP